MSANWHRKAIKEQADASACSHVGSPSISFELLLVVFADFMADEAIYRKPPVSILAGIWHPAVERFCALANIRI